MVKEATLWSYRKTDKDEWIQLGQEDSSYIEEEYQEHVQGKRMGLRVLHCFGDGCSAQMDYRKMESTCASAKCFLTHKTHRVADDHLTYKVKRELIKDLPEQKQQELKQKQQFDKLQDRLSSLERTLDSLSHNVDKQGEAMKRILVLVERMALTFQDLSIK